MKQFVKKSILSAKPYVPGKPIDEVKREMGLRRVVKLASNENPHGPSPRVLRAMEMAAKSVNRYPDGGCYHLRQKLSRVLDVDPDQLIFGNGSDELIVMAVRCFVREEDEVVLANPSFLIYHIASKIAGAKIRSVRLKDFRYDLKAMKEAVNPRTRIVFLGNPDNPCGKYLTQSEMDEFLDGLPEDVLVFLDEAYFEYVRAKDYVDSIGLLKKHRNVFVTRTFSKMYGLAGLRIGYGIGHPELVDTFNRIREPFNVNSLAQAAASACLAERPYYRKLAALFEQQREWFYRQFEGMGLKYEKTHTNFVLVDVGSDASAIAGALLKEGVIVRDMSHWGLKTFIRVSIGKDSENKFFIKKFKELVNSQNQGRGRPGR